MGRRLTITYKNLNFWYVKEDDYKAKIAFGKQLCLMDKCGICGICCFTATLWKKKLHQPKTKKVNSNHSFAEHKVMAGLEESNCELINLGTKNSTLNITYSKALNYWLKSSIFKYRMWKIEEEAGNYEWKGNFRVMYILKKCKNCFYFAKMCAFISRKCVFLGDHSTKPVCWKLM